MSFALLATESHVKEKSTLMSKNVALICLFPQVTVPHDMFFTMAYFGLQLRPLSPIPTVATASNREKQIICICLWLLIDSPRSRREVR